MTPPPPIEPTLHAVLRVFVALHVAVLTFTALAFLQHDAPHHAVAGVWAMLIACAAVLGGALSPRISAHRLYLPWALGALLLAPLLGQSLALLRGVEAFEKTALERALFVVVPLIVVAWRYPLRIVVTVAVTVGCVELGLVWSSDLDALRRGTLSHVILSRTVGLIIAGYVVARLVAQQRAQHAALARAHAQLSHHADSLERLTVSRERNRLARELHDTLAHTLSGMAVQLEAARAVWGEAPERARGMVDRSTELAREGLREARRALAALRAQPLEDLGLILALRQLAEGLASRAGIEVEVALPEAPLVLPSFVEQGLYRVAQEALENIERHSDARWARIALALEADPAAVALQIEDNGRGFEPRQVPPERYGLAGIRERAALLGAEVEIEAAPARGARVRLRKPLADVEG